MANRTANIKTTMGEFKVELFEERAPATTKNFIDLAEKNFYDGVIFHRVIEGFMAQFGIHGDPAVNAKFGEATIQDDPGKKGVSNTPGYLTYPRLLRRSRSFSSTCDG